MRLDTARALRLSSADLSWREYGEGAGETIALSSTQATPSLYLVGSSGTASSTVSTTTNSSGTSVTTTPPDQQGRLVQLDNLSSTPQIVSNTAVDPSSGTTNAQSSVVDSNGALHNYAYGLELKARLLEMEGYVPPSTSRSAVGGRCCCSTMIAMSSTLFAPAAEAHPAWFTFDGAASLTSRSESTATARIQAGLPSLQPLGSR